MHASVLHNFSDLAVGSIPYFSPIVKWQNKRKQKLATLCYPLTENRKEKRTSGLCLLVLSTLI